MAKKHSSDPNNVNEGINYLVDLTEEQLRQLKRIADEDGVTIEYIISQAIGVFIKTKK